MLKIKIKAMKMYFITGKGNYTSQASCARISSVVKLFLSPSFLAISALLILSIFALKDLTKPSFYTSHDGETHTARIAQYYQALSDGQYPPRFAGSFYGTLGSPIFVYIYPLPYFLGSVLHIVGFSFISSFKILMATAFIFSGLATYLWLREITKNEKAAFLGALFYTWVPYRFLLIYVRGSLSEVLAYAFLPLVLYFLTRLAKIPNVPSLAASAIAISLVLLSQNLVAAISLPIIFLYLVIASVKNKSPKAIFLGMLSIAWGFILSSFTYLPAIFERKFTRFDEIISVAYPDHFVTLKQLIRSPWGYGFDLPGTVNDQMSLQIGLAHIFVLGVSLVLTAYSTKNYVYFLKKKKFPATAIYFTCLFAASTFLMLQGKITSSVWREVKLLHVIDIPWRLLGITSLSLSYLAAYSAKHIKPGLYFLFLTAFVIVANRNHLRINQSVVKDDIFFTSYQGTATQYDEFTPIWRQSTRAPIGFANGNKVQALEGQAQIKNLLAKSNEVSFDITVYSEKSQVRINRFYFPGLILTDAGRELSLGSDFIVTNPMALKFEEEEDASGLLLLNLEKGDHKIKAYFAETKLRELANYLSLGSFLLALGILARNVRKFYKKA